MSRTLVVGGAYNLGNGSEFSVHEVVETVRDAWNFYRHRDEQAPSGLTER